MLFYPINAMIATDVRKSLQALRPGRLITSARLHESTGFTAQTDNALSRIYQSEGLLRIRNGIYFKPDRSKDGLIGTPAPTPADLEQAMKEQYGAIIHPSGMLAAYRVGLTHLYPPVLNYDTDKRLGVLETGFTRCVYKQVRKERLSSAGYRLGILLNAMEWLYKEEEEIHFLRLAHIKRLLNQHPLEKIGRALGYRSKGFRLFCEGFLTQKVTNHYITGMSALNIPHNGVSAGWHTEGLIHSGKLHVAGKNHAQSPGLEDGDLFDCGDFLAACGIVSDTRMCAVSERAIADMLYQSIIVKQRDPDFLVLQDLLAEIDKSRLIKLIQKIDELANTEQHQMLQTWCKANDIHKRAAAVT